MRVMNITELTLKAQEMNPNAHRGLGAEVLLAIASGEEYDLPDRAVDNMRLTIMAFLLDHWEQVKPLVACPAASMSPRACFQCTDIQVIECAVKNKETLFRK